MTQEGVEPTNNLVQQDLKANETAPEMARQESCSITKLAISGAGHRQ